MTIKTSQRTKTVLSQSLIITTFLMTATAVFLFAAYLATVPFPETKETAPSPVVTLTQPAFVTSLPNDLEFTKVTIGGKDIYYHLRQAGDMRIEKDILVYRRDPERNRYVEVRKRWRDDVPASLPTMISKSEAEAIARQNIPGTVKFSSLYLVATDTFAFMELQPRPSDPVWRVNIDNEKGNRRVAVVNAITKEYLGDVSPPPIDAYAMTGPHITEEGTCYLPSNWRALWENAAWWQHAMGYDEVSAQWPTKSEIQSQIQSDTVSVFYEVAHGSSNYFESGCDNNEAETTWAADVGLYLQNHSKMPFTFLTSCYAMCQSGTGTLSDAFRKGSDENTAVIGGCGLSDSMCESCWASYYDWQDDFFSLLQSGMTINSAFDESLIDYGQCSGCVGYDGDPDLRLVPKVYREQDIPPGEIACGMSLLPGGNYTLDHDLDCYEMNGLYLPSGVMLDCAGHYIDGHDSDDTHSGIKFIGDYSVVKNCNIRHFEYGFFVDGSTEWNQMQYNVLEANTVGIRAGYDTTYTGILNNEFYGNGIGISLGGNTSSVFGNAACNSQSFDLMCGLDVTGNVGNQNYFNQVSNFCDDQTGLYWNYCNGGINMFEECQKNPMNGKCLQMATPPPM